MAAPAAPSREQIQDIQRRLAELGRASVVADGELGPATRSALQNFQKDNGLEPTGEPDDATVALLYGATTATRSDGCGIYRAS